MSGIETNRRALLAWGAAVAVGGSTAVSAVAIASKTACSAEADPIFAAIDRHRQLWQAGADADDDELERVWSPAEAAAFEDLCRATPTSIAGVAALSAYVVENGEYEDGSRGDGSMYDYRPLRLTELIASAARQVQVGISTGRAA